ncbi:hypothetical protein V6N12_035379 [Hibiscus sabdariffa]|uniref:Uncharacterized protein n=1 Tax=Hibiscus sabdariffa TaxID=183260 RepID=A0ABR2BSP0_9ROSI
MDRTPHQELRLLPTAQAMEPQIVEKEQKHAVGVEQSQQVNPGHKAARADLRWLELMGPLLNSEIMAKDSSFREKF